MKFGTTLPPMKAWHQPIVHRLADSGRLLRNHRFLTNSVAFILLLSAGAVLFFTGQPWVGLVRPKSMAKVGILVLNRGDELRLLGFKAEMSRRGYSEGASLQCFYPGPLDNTPEQIRSWSNKMIEARVDLLMALGTQAAQIALPIAQGAGIPLLFASSMPVRAGIVKTFRHHGEAVTGLALENSLGRRVQLWKGLNPQSAHVYIPYNGNDVAPVHALSELKVILAKTGIKYTTRPVRDSLDLTWALSSVPPTVDAIFVLPDALISTHMGIIVDSALARHLPVCGAGAGAAEEGALLCYGPDAFADGKMLARLAHQVLNGVDPADLPVEVSPSILVINRRIAQRLQIDIPEEILNQADRVID